MVTSCKKGVIEDYFTELLPNMELHDFRKFQSIIDKDTNATVKKGGPLGNMTLKKNGGNWVKGNDKKGGHSGLEKSKKGVIEFKIGHQSKKRGSSG